MKIISKFKDYYDSISQTYRDEQIIYKRDITTIDLPHRYRSIEGFDQFLVNSAPYKIQLLVLGFCGKIFPLIHVIDYRGGTGRYSVHGEGFYCFEDFFKYAQTHHLLSVIPSDKKYSLFSRRYGLYMKDLKLFFSSDESNEFLKLFRAHNVPVFCIRPDPEKRYAQQLVLNPFLKEYSFHKVKDPFSAHQDLVQYISSFLHQPENPMVQISDQDKIAKHGFNKFSFRKEPTKKK